MGDINPFAVLQIPYKAATKVRPFALSTTMAVVAVLLIAVTTTLEGTFGSLSDPQAVADLRRISGKSQTPGPEEFTVMRDIASWLLAGVACLTLGLVWHQWQVFGSCISRLLDNGVLQERQTLGFNRLQRLAGYERMAGDGGFGEFLRRVNSAFKKASYFSAVLALVSVLLVMLLVRSYESLGVFRLWNVDGSGLTDAEFGQRAYDNWWASSSNLGGYLVYTAISVVFVFVILMQNAVGVIAVYTIAGLPAFCEFKADWFDRDGNFGWRPLGVAFRTVRWSLLIHGFALTLVFAMVGAGVWAYTIPLLSLWLLVIPFYLGVPALVFRNVTSTVKDKALTDVAVAAPSDLVSASLIVPYIRRASVKPLRVSQLGVYAFSASVLLPIALTAAQIAGT